LHFVFLIFFRYLTI